MKTYTSADLKRRFRVLKFSGSAAAAPSARVHRRPTPPAVLSLARKATRPPKRSLRVYRPPVLCPICGEPVNDHVTRQA